MIECKWKMIDNNVDGDGNDDDDDAADKEM